MELHSQNIRCTIQKVEQSNSTSRSSTPLSKVNRVILFGTFTYKSIATGKEITSPFGPFGAFRRGERSRTFSFSKTAVTLRVP